MTDDTQISDLLDRAAGHMHAAAALAVSRGGDDDFSDWHGLASQIRLTAAGVSHSPSVTTDLPPSVSGSLASALTALERIAPLAGPPDLTLWLWHIHELRDVADHMDQR